MTAHSHDRSTTQLLHDTVAGHPEPRIALDALLQPLRTRAFGMLLLVLALPNFIPVPIGLGAVTGVLVVGLGLQMLIGLQHPLVPGWLRRKTLPRDKVERFLARTTPLMRKLERLCKPRLDSLTLRPWSLFSGFMLVLLGILLALPIPFTNYLFGAILLAFAFALIERDGALLLALWGIALALTTLSATFSGALVKLFQDLL